MTPFEHWERRHNVLWLALGAYNAWTMFDTSNWFLWGCCATTIVFSTLNFVSGRWKLVESGAR